MWLSILVRTALGAPEPLSSDPASGRGELAEAGPDVASKVELRWTYTAGPGGMDPGDELWLEDPTFHGQRWSKWGDVSPFAEDCTALDLDAGSMSWGLVTATTSKAGLSVTRTSCGDGPGSCNPSLYAEAATVVRVESGALAEGDTITVVHGDLAGGKDCGFQTPPRAFTNVSWEAWEHIGDADWRAVEPVLLTFRPGLPEHFALFEPSVARVGETVTLHAVVLDGWGNPVPSEGEVVFDPSALGETSVTQPLDGSTATLEIPVSVAGIHRPTATWKGHTATANPIQVTEDPPVHRIYWGDIHVHHGHTWWDASGTAHEENVAYARDALALDVVAETEKALPTEIEGEALWDELQETCTRESVDDAFLVLLGFEWIGTITDSDNLGHHNVYYDACGAPIGTHDREIIPDLAGADGLWSWLEAVRSEWGIDAVTVPHATRFTGNSFEATHDLQRATEIFSGWGDSFAWESEPSSSALQHLAAGVPIGFLAASDNHDGWMGNLWAPPLNGTASSGLGAFLAPRLTRPDVFGALRDRHTYATTGPRILLQLEVEAGDVWFPQGTELTSSTVGLHWVAAGTEPIERARVVTLELTLGARPEILTDFTGSQLDLETQVEVFVSGHTAMWVEVVQADGHQAVSSPIVLGADCARLADGALDPDSLCASTPDPAADQPSCGCHTRAVRPSLVLLFAFVLGLRRR